MGDLGTRTIGRLVACALIGIVVGLVGTVAHRYRMGDVPAGLVAALLTVAFAGVLARAWAGWSGLLALGAAWVLIVQVLAVPGPGGDTLIAAEPIGYVWVYGGLAAVLAPLLAPRRWFADARPAVANAFGDRPTRIAGSDSATAGPGQ